MKYSASTKLEVNSVQDTSKLTHNHSETNADVLDGPPGSKYMFGSVTLIMYAITGRIKA